MILARLRIVLATLLLLGLGLSGGIDPVVSDWRLIASRGGEPEVVTRESQAYQALVASLPLRGVVGYLTPDDWPSESAIRRFYLAQYALTPRLVVMGTEPAYVVATPEATNLAPLSHFTLLQTFPDGLRVFKRLE